MATGLASIDWLGTVTIITATVLLLVGLQLGGHLTYGSPSVILCIVFGALFYVAFPVTQWWEDKRGGGPIMPLRIFKDLSNISALGVCAFDALVFNSVAYFLPLYFQIVLGKSPSLSGVYMLAIAIPLAVVSFTSGIIIEKSGRFLEVLQGGLFLMTIGMGLLISLRSTSDLGSIIGFLIVIGLGFGPNFGAPLIALQTRIKESDIATGTAAFGFVRMVAGAIGVVIGQVLFQALLAPYFNNFVQAGLSTKVAHQLTNGEALSMGNTISALSESQRATVRDGMTNALRGIWIFYTVVSALGLLTSFGIKRTKLQRKTESDVELESNRNTTAAP